jgi:hypothetical protein
MKPTDPTPPSASSGRGPDPRRTPPGHDSHALDRHHAAHGHADHDGLYNEDVAHEYSDVNIRGLLIFGLGIVVITAVVLVSMWGLFEVFERQAAQNDPVMSPLAVPAGQTPPEPRLLTDEPLNLQTIKTGEREVLEGYGWVDQQQGIARIPIEEAKKRLLQQGLPVRADSKVEPWMGKYSASQGESSGGRMIPVRPGVTGPDQPAQPQEKPEDKPEDKPAPQKSGGH